MAIGLKWFTAGEVETDLTNGSPHKVQRINGSGLSSLRAISDPAPGRAGVTDRLTAAGSRRVRLDMTTSGATASAAEANVRTLAEAVAGTVGRQIPREGRLQLTNSNGDVRELIAKGMVGMGLDERTRSGEFLFRHTLELEAARPFWFNPVEQVFNDVFLPDGGGMIVPTVVPTHIPPSTPESDSMLAYLGTAESWSLVIIINGPSVNPQITHGPTGFGLSFDLTVPLGGVLTIKMGPRPEIGDDGRFTALLNEASAIGSLGTFRRPFPMVLGVNEILIQQDNHDGNAVQCRWFDEYVSA